MLLSRFCWFKIRCPADNCGMVGESGGTLLIPDLHRRSVGGTTP